MKPSPCRLRIVLAAVLVLAIFAVGDAAAGAPTDQLRAHVDRILQILEDPALKPESKAAQRRAAMRRVAAEIIDFEEAAKRSLAQHWRARSATERQEFVRLFTDLLERSYITKIEQYQGEKVAYVGEAVEGEQATVRTRIVTKQGTEVPVNYRLHRKGDRWLVYDVVIEGVSLVANYRTQFNRIIQTSSYPALVDKLKARESVSPPALKERQRT